jgi:hypothetical protein
MHLALEKTVVGEGHGGATIAEVADSYGGRTVGEDVVLDLKDLARHVRA